MVQSHFSRGDVLWSANTVGADVRSRQPDYDVINISNIELIQVANVADLHIMLTMPGTASLARRGLKLLIDKCVAQKLLVWMTVYISSKNPKSDGKRSACCVES